RGLASDPVEVLGLTLRLGRVESLLGDLGEAEAVLSGVAEESSRRGAPHLRAAALIELAVVARHAGRAAVARQCVDEAEALAVELGDRALELRASYESALLHNWFDADARAESELLRVVELAGELPDQGLEIRARRALSILLFNRGELSGAQRQLTQVLA